MAQTTAEEFLRLVQPQWGALHRTARRYVASGDESRDLVQETMLRAWRTFAPAAGRSYTRSWLYVILRSVVIDWQRAAHRRIRLVVAADAELTELAPADLTEPFSALPALDEERFREFLDDRIAAALEALPAAFREVVVLSVAGELNYREIADVLECPLGTVMSRMARARRLLRENLASFAPHGSRQKERQP